MDRVFKYGLAYCAMFLTIEYVAGKNLHRKSEESADQFDLEEDLDLFEGRNLGPKHPRYPRRALDSPIEKIADATPSVNISATTSTKKPSIITAKPKLKTNNNVKRNASNPISSPMKLSRFRGNNISNKITKLASSNKVKPKLNHTTKKLPAKSKSKPKPTKKSKSKPKPKKTAKGKVVKRTKKRPVKTKKPPRKPAKKP